MSELISSFQSGDVRIIAGQILGFIAFIVATISFQGKQQRTIMIMQSVSTAVFAINLYLLGAYTGMMLNIVGCIRSILYTFRNKYDWIGSFYVASVFFVASIICATYTGFNGEGFRAMLPLAGMILTTLASREKEASKVRLFTLLNSPFWLVYNATIKPPSIGGIFTEIFVMSSIVIGMIRLDRKKQKKTENE